MSFRLAGPLRTGRCSLIAPSLCSLLLFVGLGDISQGSPGDDPGWNALAQESSAAPLSPVQQLAAPDDPSYREALLAHQVGDDQAAWKILSPVLSADSAPVYVILAAEIESGLEHFKKAEALVASALGREKQSRAKDDLLATDALNQAWGDIALRRHHFGEALDHYRQVRPNQAPRFMLSRLYAEVGSNDLLDAQRLLPPLKELNHTSPAYFFGQAAIEEALQNHEQALLEIEAAKTSFGELGCLADWTGYLQLFAPAPRDR